MKALLGLGRRALNVVGQQGTQRIASIADEIREAPLMSALVALLTIGLLFIPGAVLVNLDRGLDWSDTGYYLVSIRRLPEISMQTTQFAVVWNLFPLPDTVTGQRVALWGLLCLTGGAFAVSGLSWLNDIATPNTLTRFLAFALGSASTSSYYFIWLPDPSYNALALVFSLASLAITFHLMRSARADFLGPSQVPALILLGSTGMALCLTRPPTGAALALILSTLLIGWHRPPLLRTLAAVCWVMLGAALVLVAIQFLVEPLPQTVSRIIGGVERRDILQRSTDYLGPAWRYIIEMKSLLSPQSIVILLGFAIGFALSIRNLNGPSARARTAGAIFMATAAGTLIFFFGNIPIIGFAPQDFGLQDVSAYERRILVITAIVAITAVASIPAHWIARKALTRMIMFMLGCSLAQIALVFGTGNAWWFQTALFAAPILIGLGVLLISKFSAGPLAGSVTATFVIAVASMAALANGFERPYRLPTPLTEQRHRTMILENGGTIRVDSLTHANLTALEQLRDRISAAGRPLLLDATGRLPLVSVHIGAQVPNAPWMTSHLPGSQAFFDYTVASLSTEELESAWILMPVDATNGYSIDSLEARGRDRARDYEIVHQSMYPYPGYEVQLLAPRQP